MADIKKILIPTTPERGHNDPVFGDTKSGIPTDARKEPIDGEELDKPLAPQEPGEEAKMKYSEGSGTRTKSSFIEDDLKNQLTPTEKADLTDSGTTTLHTHTDDVKLTGDQTIAGVKTFTSFPVTPSSAPTTDYQTPNKKYVDDNIGNGVNNYDFTFGETITAGQVVCYKKKVTKSLVAIDRDAETDDQNPTATSGSDTTLELGFDGIGGHSVFSLWFGFNVANSYADKVLLKFYGNIEIVGTLQAYRVTANWAEATITHTNQPGWTDDLETGCPDTVIGSTGWQYVEMDITNIVRGQMSTFWDENDGVRIQFDGNVGHMTAIRSSETADTNHEPHLLITSGIDLEGDGKVYVADNSDINTSNNVLGIATEGGNLDDVKEVQFDGILTGQSGLTPGQEYYLTTSGAIQTKTAFGFNLDTNQTKIGKALTATVLQLDIEQEKFLWKSEPIRITGAATNYVFPPIDSQECFIKLYYKVSSGSDDSYENLVLKRNSPNSAIAKLFAGSAGGAGGVVTYTWDDTNNKITFISSVGASPNYTESTFYFYK